MQQSGCAAIEAQIAQHIERSKTLAFAGEVAAALANAQQALVLRQQLAARLALAADHGALAVFTNHTPADESGAEPLPGEPGDETPPTPTRWADETPALAPACRDTDDAAPPPPMPLPASIEDPFDDLLWPADDAADDECSPLPDYDYPADFPGATRDPARPQPAQPRGKQQKAAAAALKERRALEWAAALGRRYGWDVAGVNILAAVFVRYYSGASRQALVRQLDAGLTPEELSVALAAREVWEDCGNFHVSGYGHENWTLGWPLAVAVARELDADAGEDEIHEFLCEAHDCWRSSPGLLREYPDFRSYLAYSLGLTGHSVSAPPHWTFVAAPSEDY